MTKTPVPVASLKIGMFVAELDRPWSETPFLTEGFLIAESDQMEMLRNYCRRVFIDPLRSSPESLSHLGDLRATQRESGWDGERAFEITLGKLFPEWKKKVVSSKLAGRIARASHFVDQRVLASLGQSRTRRQGNARTSSDLGHDAAVYLPHSARRSQRDATRPVRSTYTPSGY